MNEDLDVLRRELVKNALAWERLLGVAPSITNAISEYDAVKLVKCSHDQFSKQNNSRTAVTRGYDFIFNDLRYQVKANRPSGKPGSKVTIVPLAKNYDFDKLIWILYNKEYEIQEAWLWDVEKYKKYFFDKKRARPDDMRNGVRLLQN